MIKLNGLLRGTKNQYLLNVILKNPYFLTSISNSSLKLQHLQLREISNGKQNKPDKPYRPAKPNKDSMDAYQISERITNLADSHRLDEAIELVDNTPIRNLSVVVYNHLISSLIKINRLNAAYKMYNKVI
jgi:pentatricopeptide repeat protein